MNQLQFEFKNIDEAKKEILIALLADIGFTGFEEDDEGLKAFIAEDEFDKVQFESTLEQAAAEYVQTSIAPQNWNAQWESGYEPVMVDDFAAVRASFHTPITTVKHEIVITPKMSFGTGHHATTFLMMQQMASVNFQNKAVLDFGTGTGVLAILAEKLGAATVTAIDNDEWSIENAAENIAGNGCKSISLAKADIIPDGKLYDIILANINLNVITSAIIDIKNAAGPGAVVLLSGFLNTDEAVISATLTSNGFAIETISEKKNWLCIKCSRIN